MALNTFINTQADDAVVHRVENLQKSVITKSKYDGEEFEKNRVIKLSGSPETLDKIERMLAYMQYLGDIGHSTSFTVDVDGDGAFSVEITDESGERISKKRLDEITSPQGEDIKAFSFD